MADNKKIYSIQINGIDQSIKQVDALSNTLDALDKKIKEMEGRTVNVATNGGSKSSVSTLTEEAALQKEINRLKNEGATLDAKIAIYKKALAI